MVVGTGANSPVPGGVLEGNVLTSAELKRRGIAAIEQALEHGPVHLIKRNQAAAVVLSEQHCRQLQLQASLTGTRCRASRVALAAQLAAGSKPTQQGRHRC